MYAANTNPIHKQSMNDNSLHQHQVTKDNLLGNMLASHNQNSMSLNTSVNPRPQAMNSNHMNASASTGGPAHTVSSTKNTIKSPKTNIQSIPINKHGNQLVYQPPRPHSQNKDTMPKNGRIAGQDPN
jgi:hypothetical protein